jgi:hypothetical protein
MKKVYQLSTKEYEPISIGSRYLFEQFDAIFSFLKPKIESKFLNSFAKPILNEKSEIIEWYAEYSGEFMPLNSFDSQKQIDLKQKYWEFKYAIEDIVNSLPKAKNNLEVGQWHDKLNATFNEDNNFILSNGDDFVVLWGWVFNSSSSNYLAPQFLPLRNVVVSPFLEGKSENNDSIDSDDHLDKTNSLSNDDTALNRDNPVGVITEQSASPQNINVIINTIETEKKETDVVEEPETIVGQENIKLTFWERIKRFFRWISYRFWALMLLIILVMLLCCLCKKCSNKNAVRCDNCKELDSINKRLEETKIRLKENCPPN